MTGFFKGIVIKGLEHDPGTGDDEIAESNQLIDMVLDRQCDDSVSNTGGTTSGVGTLIQGSSLGAMVIKHGCDKCIQDEGQKSLLICGGTDWQIDSLDDIPQTCWHTTYDTVEFDGCETPVRFTGEGRHLVRDSLIHDSSTEDPHVCFGPVMGAQRLNVRMEGTTVDGCERGIVMEGMSTGTMVRPKYVLEKNIIKNSPVRGILARVKAKVTANRNEIVDNGGEEDEDPTRQAYSGVGLTNAFGDSPQVILGADPGAGSVDCDDPSVAGCNVICDNLDKNGADLEVDNRRSASYTVDAQNNWWCNSGNEPTDVSSGVTTSHPLPDDPRPFQ